MTSDLEIWFVGGWVQEAHRPGVPPSLQRVSHNQKQSREVEEPRVRDYGNRCLSPGCYDQLHRLQPGLKTNQEIR